MKLVDILAEEYEEWPEGLHHICQNRDGELAGAIEGQDSWYHPGEGMWYTSDKLKVSEDHEYAKVTQAMWQEARQAKRQLSEKYKPAKGDKCLTWVEDGEDGAWEKCVVDHVGDNYVIVNLINKNHPTFDRAVPRWADQGTLKPLSKDYD